MLRYESSLNHGLGTNMQINTLSCCHTSWLLKIGVVLLSFVLVSCGTAEPPFPVYPNIKSTVRMTQLGQYPAIQPYFGDSLKRVDADYYIADAAMQDVTQWYNYQVANQQLIYVDAQIQSGQSSTLYEFPAVDFQRVEVLTYAINANETLLVILQSVDVNKRVDGNAGWVLRLWGWLLGWSGPNPIDDLLGRILGWLSPAQGMYETVFFRPIFNLYVVLRTVLDVHFIYIVIIHALIIGYIYNVLGRIIGFLPGLFLKQNTGDETKDLLSGCVGLGGAQMYNGLQVLAVWQSLTTFFDVSSASRGIIQAHIYTWVPDVALLSAQLPPSGDFLGVSLVKPSIVFVPLFVFIITSLSALINVGLAYENVRFHEERGRPPNALAKAMVESFEQEPLSTLSELVRYIIRQSLILAFVPLGVAWYYIIGQVLTLYAALLHLLDERIKRTINIVGNVLYIIGIAWIAYRSYSTLIVPQPIISQPRIEVRSLPTSTPRPTTIRVTPTLAPVYGQVSTRSLRVRSSPSTEGGVLGGLVADQQVLVAGRSDDSLWAYVEYAPEKFGWVSIDFLRVEDDELLRLPVIVVGQ